MIFETVARVLTTLDDYGSETHGDAWDEMVKERITEMSAGYQRLTVRDRDVHDYSGEAASVGYLYMYAVRHADFIYQLLRSMIERTGKPDFSAKTLRVASVGGGPGSDLIGIVKYLGGLPEEDRPNKIVYTIYDKELSWLHVAEEVVDEIDTEIEIDLIFQELDVTSDCSNYSLQRDDLVVMSYFISEVCTLPGHEQVQRSVEHLLGSVRAGASVLYNDSCSPAFYRFFNYRRNEAGRFTELYDTDQLPMRVQERRPAGIYDDLESRLGWSPKLDGSVLAKLAVRT